MGAGAPRQLEPAEAETALMLLSLLLTLAAALCQQAHV